MVIFSEQTGLFLPMRLAAAILLAFFLLLGLPVLVSADSGVVINEILANPSGDEAAGEFIELINISEEKIDLEGWMLDDIAGAGSDPYVFPDRTRLKPQEILLLSREETGITLNNSNDAVRLLLPDGTVAEEVPYQSTTEDVSLARTEAGVFLATNIITPGEENVFLAESPSPTPTVSPQATSEPSENEDDEQERAELEEITYSDEIEINEFLPNPEGSDTDNEFIELRNAGGDEVDLSGWMLDDEADKGSSPYTIGDKQIAGGAIINFARSETKIALNNTSDSVRLLNPLGEVVDVFEYDDSEESVAYARNSDGDFAETTTPTPGEPNKITEPKNEEEEDDEEIGEDDVGNDGPKQVVLKDIRQEKMGEQVTTTGVVSVEPGLFGKQTIYLAGSGIQLFFSKGDWPDLKLGDTVSVTGVLSESRGETRLKISQASDISKTKSNTVPDPHVVKTGEVAESLEGFLVKISGAVTETSGSTFYVDDGSGEVKVYIKGTTGIKKPRMKVGMPVTITGVVSETTSGYRILPRLQEDVLVGGQVAGVTSFPKAGQIFGGQKILFGLFVVPAVLIGLAYKQKEPLLW